MDFGVHLPLMARAGESPLDLLTAFVRDAARLGYKHLVFNDHFIFGIDPPIALASVIGVSGEMKLVPSVLLPVQRGLVPSAKMLAAFDILSGGRLIAGIGPGSMELEYEISRIPFEERWKRFDEMAMSLRALLQPSESPFIGNFYSTEGINLEPKPVQQPKLPIWIGSWGSDAGLRRVARFGDGWLASAFESTPASFREASARLGENLVAEGKDPAGFPNAVSTMFTYVSRDESRLAEVGRFGPFGQRPAGQEGREPPPRVLQQAQAHVRQPPLVGTPEQCAERLSGFNEAGVQTLYLAMMVDPMEQLHYFMEEVAPLVR
jgi:alkanesulfonate monooxygenase SsuD/methylene tetrahydromethanopterin reductase-like flavin-dependent oxidoreductase (luciferase family)